MNPLLDMKLTPGGSKPDIDTFKMLRKIAKDNELFRACLDDTVKKYSQMMDLKVQEQDAKIARIGSQVSVDITYDSEAEEIKIT